MESSKNALQTHFFLIQYFYMNVFIFKSLMFNKERRHQTFIKHLTYKKLNKGYYYG